MHREDGDDPPSTSPPRLRGWLWRSCLYLAWFVTLSLAVVAALRIVYHDGYYLLVWINAFTRYVYLPVYACLAWAVWQRRWRLALVGAMVAACHLAWLAPEFRRDRRFDVSPEVAAAPADESTTIRILFANVTGDNENPAAFLEEIPAINPDVIVFVEYYPWWHREVLAHPALKSYPYGQPKFGIRGGEFAVYSKLPIENPQQVVTDRRFNLTFDVRIDDKPLHLFCLHAPRPMTLHHADYYGFWKETTPKILAVPDPAIIVGDFNATPHSRVYKTLTAGHLRSAHDDRGRGYATTWPNGMVPVPPIRIDQALLTPGVECLQITEGRGLGSDHKPLILDVRIRK